MAKADRIRDAISLDSSVGEERLRMILGRVEATHKEERAMVQSLVNLHHEIVAVQEKMSGEGVELREWGMRLAGDRERLGKRERRFSLDDFDDATYYV